MTPTPEQIEGIGRAVLRRIAELRERVRRAGPDDDIRFVLIELRALEAVTGEKG
jgi:hypothetical protein